jgi:hypothetical protein
MTVATLLAHVGIDVPRYVTVDGKIVLNSSGPRAAVVSPMRIEPHRFHGGDDPAPPRNKYDKAWWSTDLEARALDENSMRTHFPGFSLHSENGDYFWSGKINTGRGMFAILVLPHVDHSLPSVVPSNKNLGRPEGRRLRKPPHLYNSGALCVAAATDWDPSRHTTATAVGWAAHWFAAYTEWRMRGYWPTDGYGAVA